MDFFNPKNTQRDNNIANVPALAFTHAGRFHADDVFCAALLRMLRGDIRIYRGFTIPKNFSGIVFDIGEGKYDHHQKNSERRPNGVAYASFGLLWREYGQVFLSEKQAAYFDEKFIQPLDIDDNTGTGHVLAVLLGSYNPVWDEERDSDEAFFEAVAVAQSLLYNRLRSIAAVERGQDEVKKALTEMKNGVVVLKKYVPWKPVLIPSEAAFAVFPSPRGGFSVQCVPRDYAGKTGNKIPMPPEWHAAPAAELQRITGVVDVTFCHASGFMCTVGSMEGALKLAQLATQYAEEQKQKRKEEKQARRAEHLQRMQADENAAQQGEDSTV